MTASDTEILQAIRPRWVVILMSIFAVLLPGLKGLVFLFFSDLYFPAESDQDFSLRRDEAEIYYTFVDAVRDMANGYLFIVAAFFITLRSKELLLVRTIVDLAVPYFIILGTFMTVEAVQWGFYDPFAFVVDGVNLLVFGFMKWKLLHLSTPDPTVSKVQ